LRVRIALVFFAVHVSITVLHQVDIGEIDVEHHLLDKRFLAAVRQVQGDALTIEEGFAANKIEAARVFVHVVRVLVAHVHPKVEVARPTDAADQLRRRFNV